MVGGHQDSPSVLKGLCWGTKEKNPGFRAFVIMTSNSSSKSFLVTARETTGSTNDGRHGAIYSARIKRCRGRTQTNKVNIFKGQYRLPQRASYGVMVSMLRTVGRPTVIHVYGNIISIEYTIYGKKHTARTGRMSYWECMNMKTCEFVI